MQSRSRTDAAGPSCISSQYLYTYISDAPAAQATRRCGGGFLVRVPSSYRYSWHNRFDRFETEFASESVLFRYMRIVRTGSLQSVSTFLFDFSLAVSRGYYSPLGLRRDWCISKLTYFSSSPCANDSRLQMRIYQCAHRRSIGVIVVQSQPSRCARLEDRTTN